MKRQTPVHEQVFKVLYPNGQEKPEDPKDWSALVRKELIREARFECKSFYGEDLGATVLQPGLDYAYPPHRRRLGRFDHHNRLFAAMDKLGLTAWEIYNLCCWENTAYARDWAQQRRPGEKIDDDTGDDIPTWEEVQAERRRALVDDGVRGHALDQHASYDAPEAPHDSDGTVDGDACASPGDDVEMGDYELQQRYQYQQWPTSGRSAELQRRGHPQAATSAARLSSSFRPPFPQSAIAPA